MGWNSTSQKWNNDKKKRIFEEQVVWHVMDDRDY